MKTLIDIDNFQVNIRGSTGALVVGKPGSGKSVLLSYLLLIMMSFGAFPLIADTKRSDFFSLGNILLSIYGESNLKASQRVCASPSQVARMLRILNKLMNDRYETHNDHWSWDWVDYHLRPIVVIFDEFSATLAEADRATGNEIINYLKQIVFKARQMGGIYLILASQRLTADVLERNISSEFATRIGMQNLDRISLSLAFPGCDLKEIPRVENIPGHGLIYDDRFKTTIPQPFVAPNMSRVDVPGVFKKLEVRNQFNDFAKESYWPW